MSVRIIKDTHLEGLRALAKRLQTSHERVMVGVPAGAHEADGTSIALIAAVHEYGSPSRGIPERSFIRAGIKRGRPQFSIINFDSLKKVANGTFTIHQALDRLGLAAASAVKDEILNGTFTPLKPATIARKGSSKPLIESAALLQAVTWTVEGAIA